MVRRGPPEEGSQVLASFPRTELSYEKRLHRKVPADVYMVLPKGRRAFLWFTHHNRRNVARLVTADQQGRPRESSRVVLAFSDRLASGTVLSGTIFERSQNTYFCADDLLWNAGESTGRIGVAERLLALARVMSDIGRSDHASFVVGTPVIATTYRDALRLIDELPYEVRGVQARRTRGAGSVVGVHPHRPRTTTRAVFEVRATVDADIYELSCAEGATPVRHGIAAVATYEDSVMMNRIFRTIRENDNLDLLEESEDEDTFENISADKYVQLGKVVLMECVHVSRFGRWRPVRPAPPGAQPTQLASLHRAEKK